jgi:hypothetical protein
MSRRRIGFPMASYVTWIVSLFMRRFGLKNKAPAPGGCGGLN